MSRILFAWELGAYYGHLSRQIPIADQLRKLGYDIGFAVRDPRVAAELLAPRRFAFMQAPFWFRPSCLVGFPVNYAELLIAEGHADVPGLWGMVRSWIGLFELFRPNALVIDHSPTALLAARIVGLPAVLIGSGFEIPPDRFPLPSIRPWESVDEDRLRRAEDCVLDSINTVCKSFKASPLNRVAELFGGSVKILATFAELDHYGLRSDEIYAGPILSGMAGRSMTWLGTGLPRVFAYLRPSVPGFEALLSSLSLLEAEVLIAAPGIRRVQAEAVASSRCRVVDRPIRLDRLVDSSDLAISYGGVGMVSNCLLAGLPMLLVPQNVEQYLLSRRVEALGAGLVSGERRNEADFVEILTGLLREPRYRRNANAFARNYADFNPERPISQAVRTIAALSQGNGANEAEVDYAVGSGDPRSRLENPVR
jgi:UDP:flavonoid glycosyltransferase YjiC (YdhE family)